MAIAIDGKLFEDEWDYVLSQISNTEKWVYGAPKGQKDISGPIPDYLQRPLSMKERGDREEDILDPSNAFPTSNIRIREGGMERFPEFTGPVEVRDGTITDADETQIANSIAAERIGMRYKKAPTASPEELSSQIPIIEPNINAYGGDKGPAADYVRQDVEPNALFGANRYITWPERMAKDLVDSFVQTAKLASGTAYNPSLYDEPTMMAESGQMIDPKQAFKENVHAVMNTGGLVTLAPAPVVSKIADGTLGSIAGISAKTADTGMLEVAKTLDRRGHTTNEIWETTGWYKGTDDLWRHELPSQTAKLTSAVKPPTYEDAIPLFKDAGISLDITYGRSGRSDQFLFRKWGSDRNNPENYIKEAALPDNLRKMVADLQGAWTPAKEAKLSEILDFPELYKAYPEFKDLKVTFNNTPGFLGHYHPDEKRINLNLDVFNKPFSKDKLIDTVLHEVQHAIQSREGFVYGTTEQLIAKQLKEYMKNLPPDKADQIAGLVLDYLKDKPVYKALKDELYARAPGEREARLVESRREWTKAEKAGESPAHTQRRIDETTGQTEYKSYYFPEEVMEFPK